MALVVIGCAAVVQAANTDAHTVTITVNEIAELNVTTSNVALDVTAPTAAGGSPQGDSDATSYLQYTSTVVSGATRTITAQITSGTVPSGLTLNAEATASGATNAGSAVSGGVDLSSTAQTIVSGIGSCATGTGATDGANLTYTLSVDTPSSLVIGSTTLTVTYTLTDDL